MKIGIQTWGSHGDIRPMLALADALSKKGCEIILSVAAIDQSDFTEFAEEIGITCRSICKNLSFDVTACISHVQKTHNFLKQASFVFNHTFEPAAEELYTDAVELCRTCDAVIGHHVLFPLRLAAQETNTPYIAMLLFHGAIPFETSSPPGYPSFGNRLNPVLRKLANAVFVRSLGKHVNRFMKQHNREPIKDLLKEAWSSPRLNITGVSQIFTENRDLPENYQVCGYLDLPTELWPLPPEAEGFMHKGEPPVYFGFGSMQQFNSNDMETLFSEASRLAGIRAVIKTESPEKHGLVSGDICFLHSCNHELVFPSCSLIVHHGGSGTTHAAVQAGIPSLVVEHFGDQLIWGKELKRLGLAKHLLHIRNLTAKRLAKAVKESLSKPELMRNAADASIRMLSENGPKTAAGMIINNLASG